LYAPIILFTHGVIARGNVGVLPRQLLFELFLGGLNGAASESVSFIPVLHLGPVMVGSVMYFLRSR